MNDGSPSEGQSYDEPGRVIESRSHPDAPGPPDLCPNHDDRAVILGELSDKAETTAEAEHFVSTLLEHDDVRMPTGKRGRSRRSQSGELPSMQTHTVGKSRDKRVLKRIRFSCCANLHRRCC